MAMVVKSIPLSFESFAAQEMDYKEAEKMINEAAKDMNPVLATEIVQNNKGEYPRLARQGSLGEIQHAWDKTSPGSGVYNVTYSQAEMIRKFQQISMTGSLSSPLPDNSRTVKDLNHHFGTDMALDALESKQITSPEYQNHRVRR